MKKILTLALAGLAALTLAACGASSSSENASAKGATRDFQADNGIVKVPTKLNKVVVQNYPDEAFALGMNVVGTETWSYANPYFTAAQKKGLTDLGAPMNAEEIAKLSPDLIVTIDKDKVADYEKIAPTVWIDYTKLDTMTQRLDYFAKLFDAESAKDKFLKKFAEKADAEKQKLTDAGIDTKGKTIALIELQGNKIYAYGDNFARGGQTLTYGLGFEQSPEMKEVSAGAGYKELNIESLASLSADYIFIDYPKQDKAQYDALLKNPIWQSVKAVKAGHVVKVNYEDVYYFGGPLATEGMLPLYTDAIIDQTK
jgi:iron complex transport system substrate-binding protein